MDIDIFSWSLVGLFCGCFWGIYTLIKGVKTGVITASINHINRTFHRGERYFNTVLIMLSIVVVTGLCIGIGLLWFKNH